MKNKVAIIAELAQGFEGNYELARLLVKAAASAGADAAKFQLVYADELATPDYKYYELFSSLEMPDEEWQKIADYATELQVELYLDIFGLKSLRLSERMAISAIKLHGTDIANVGLLNEVAASSIPHVILGAGGAHLDEIDKAINILKAKKVTILLGFQGYPTPNETNQIIRISVLMNHIKEKHTNISIGFADHADPTSPLRYALAAAAIGAGASVIEKHLTLGMNMKMEDHESALNPDDFLEFVSIVRDCDLAMGDADISTNFNMSTAEQDYRKLIRRHAVSSHDLTEGSILGPSDIVLKRSSADQVITDLTEVYNRKLNKDIVGNSAILKTDLK